MTLRARGAGIVDLDLDRACCLLGLAPASDEIAEAASELVVGILRGLGLERETEEQRRKRVARSPPGMAPRPVPSSDG